MLEPNGPLPPEIYWRRRALAIGCVVVVLLLLVWLISSIAGGDDSPESEAAAASSSLTTPVSISSTASGSSSAGGGSGSGGSGGGGAAAAGDTSVEKGSSSSGAGSSTTTASGQPVAAGQCPDQSLAIKVAADKPTYAAGEEPSFTTVITNIGTVACERDLGSSLQQVLVYTIDGSGRLWSNIDCFPQSAPDVRNLAPGQQAQFTVKWSARTSAPDCLTQPEPRRDPVGPGAYTVVGQLGQLRSAPEPFNLA